MRDVMRMRETFFFLVDDRVDRALAPARYRFRFVASGIAEAEAGKQPRKLVGSTVVDSKFDKFHAETFRPRWHLRKIGGRSSGLLAQLIHEVDKRALAIDCDRARRAGPELVVEDFERQIALIPGRLDRRHEIEERQIALPR